MNLAVISFTTQGKDLQKKVVNLIEKSEFFNDVYFSIFDKEKEDLKEFLEVNFYKAEGLIFIGAAGIAVRLISKLMVSKDKDPAVIVMDEVGKFVIPILSGHLGGANALAQKISELLDAEAVITTATDVHNKFSVDDWSREMNCTIEEIPKIKLISMAILRDDPVGLYSDFEITGDLPMGLYRKYDESVEGEKDKSHGNTGICISLDVKKNPFKTTLHVIPKVLTLGIGCKKGKDAEELRAFIEEIFEKNHISLKGINAVSSIDLKKDEQCILKFAEKEKIEFVVYDAKTLEKAEGEFSGSPFVKNVTGTDNICERSAVMLSAGTLLIRKEAKNGMTVAVAKTEWRCKF